MENSPDLDKLQMENLASLDKMRENVQELESVIQLERQVLQVEITDVQEVDTQAQSSDGT